MTGKRSVSLPGMGDFKNGLIMYFADMKKVYNESKYFP
jgi:hypothetical protein